MVNLDSLINNYGSPKVLIDYQNQLKKLIFNFDEVIYMNQSRNVFINDKWALFEHEPKSNLIFHNIDDGIIKNGENKITIKVTDGVGNKTEFNSKVYWSN